MKFLNKRSRRLAQQSTAGFTLIEVVVALALMMISLVGVLILERANIDNIKRSKELTTVANLLKEAMILTEFEFEGKSFDEVREEATESFKPPYQRYKWRYKIEEVEFPSLAPTAGEDGKVTQQQIVFGRLVSNYLSKAIREVTVTVFWGQGERTEEQSLSTYWVNLNNEFRLSE